MGFGVAVLVPAGCAGAAESARPADFALRWISNASPDVSWTLEVSGGGQEMLGELRLARWSNAQWQKLLAVHVEQRDPLGGVGLPPMAGTYQVGSGVIQFVPQFPLEPGLSYVASFHPSLLPGSTGGRFVSLAFKLPERRPGPSAFVVQIYPTSAVLPENLLKFYVHFSAPMSRGHIYDHLHLRNAAGQEVELPFLEIDEELWNPDMTRLTLFIDPGRIKRGVKPLEDIGPALEEGKQFTLAVGAGWLDAAGQPLQRGFEKTFRVGAPDRAEVDVAAWRITPAASGTRAMLTVTFPKPMDHALAQRMIRVADESGRPVAGTITLENQERRWGFAPSEPWRAGRHLLLVQKTIEDLAGNNVGKSFEVDVFEKVQARFTNTVVRLPFEVK